MSLTQSYGRPSLADLLGGEPGSVLTGSQSVRARFRTTARPLIDFREFVADENDLFNTDTDCGPLLTAAHATVHDLESGLLLPEGTMHFGSTYRPPTDGPQLIGRGRGVSVLKPFDTFFSPIVGSPAAGDNVSLDDALFQDFTIDGAWADSQLATTTATNRDAVTAAYGPTLICTTDLSGFELGPFTEWTPGLGRAQWLNLTDTGADPDQFSYTGVLDNGDGTWSFLGVTPIDDSKRTPRSHAAGGTIRLANQGLLGLFDVYHFNRMRLIRVELINGGSYGLALEGYSTNARGPMFGLYAEDCTFGYNGQASSGDNCDIKTSEFLVMNHCDAPGGGDKGFNVRVKDAVFLGCTAHGSNVGFGMDVHEPVDPDLSRFGQVSIAIAANATSVTVNNVKRGFTAPASGHIEIERVSWTTATNNGDGTWTLSGLTRGLEATRPVAHLATSPGVVTVRVVQDFDPDEVEDAFVGTDQCSVTMVGCSANDCSLIGISGIASGAASRLTMHIYGGGSRRSRSGLVLQSGAGIVDAQVFGGNYEDSITNNIKCSGVDVPQLMGVRSNGAGTGPSGGSGILLDRCHNGSVIGGYDIRGNSRYGLEMTNGSQYVRDTGGIAHGNTLNSALEINADTNIGDTLFPTKKVNAVSSDVTLPSNDATNWTDLTGLSFLVADNPTRVWRAEFDVFVTSNGTTGDIKFSVTAPSTTIVKWGPISAVPASVRGVGAVAAGTTPGFILGKTESTDVLGLGAGAVLFRILMLVQEQAGSTGSVQLRARQGTSSADVTTINALSGVVAQRTSA